MSKAFTISLVLVTLLVGGIAGFAVAAVNPESENQALEAKTQVETSKAADTTDVVSLYTDQRYLQEMIAHHEVAVNMSKQVLAHTSRKEIRQMASDIIENQTKEIEAMKRWYEEWK